jgi:hypothetical protein
VPRAALNYYYATVGPTRHQGQGHGAPGETRGNAKGTGGHRDTTRTGGHSGGIGRDTKRTGGNNGGIGASRKAKTKRIQHTRGDRERHQGDRRARGGIQETPEGPEDTRGMQEAPGGPEGNHGGIGAGRKAILCTIRIQRLWI